MFHSGCGPSVFQFKQQLIYFTDFNHRLVCATTISKLKISRLSLKGRNFIPCIAWVDATVMCVYTAVLREVVKQNRTQKCQKVLWIMGVPDPWWRILVFLRHKGNSSRKCMYAFSFLVGKHQHREPQSINAKLFVPIIQIGIVAYA